MPEKVVVTGSTGKVGSQLVDQLAASGAAVVAAVQPTSKVDAIKRAGATPVVVNFESAESIIAAFEGVDRLFLLTPLIPDQIGWSARVVDAAKAASVKHIVKLSVMGADWPQPTLFGKEHAEMERYIRQSGVPYTFLHPTFFMQNLLGEATIKTQGAFYGCAGDGKASYIDTRDIAAVATAALTKNGHEGKTYELTGPELLSNGDLATTLSSATGREIRYVNLSDEGVRDGMTSAGVPTWLIQPLIDLAVNQREGRFATISGAVDEITGRKPLTFEQFVREHIEAFK
jgi:uncharacterized protein YbjT (DUF2867 family)